jgi:CRISPR-associated protein Csb2
MNCHLCISVTFLDPFFHGAGDEAPEWPPSPMRLFQALIAGSRAGCREASWNETRSDAFSWLAGLQPPLIIAPSVRRLISSTLFVPNNESDKESDRQKRLKSKVVWPHRLLDGDAVHFSWSFKNCSENKCKAEVLCAESRNLLALGWGIDQVAGNGRILIDTETAALPGERWCAWNRHGPGVSAWRVPTAASLGDLERVYQSFMQRIKGNRYHPPLKTREFKTVEYLRAKTLPPRSYAVFELPDGVAFRQEGVATVAAMLRSVACRKAKADTHDFPGGSESYVAGHQEKLKGTPPRFSYLPLPTIGHQHADGMIRRLLIAEPFGGDGVQAQWAQDRLRNATVRDIDGNDHGALQDVWRATSRPMLRRYVGESRSWCSVTPVILPGYDDRKQSKAEKLVLAACAQADLPIEAIEDLTIRKAPFWPGSASAQHYMAPNYLKNLPRWHVSLKFSENLPGPISVGAGRHAGLGVLAATKES